MTRPLKDQLPLRMSAEMATRARSDADAGTLALDTDGKSILVMRESKTETKAAKVLPLNKFKQGDRVEVKADHRYYARCKGTVREDQNRTHVDCELDHHQGTYKLESGSLMLIKTTEGVRAKKGRKCVSIRFGYTGMIQEVDRSVNVAVVVWDYDLSVKNRVRLANIRAIRTTYDGVERLWGM